MDKKFEDVGAQTLDADGDGDQDILVVSGGNDYPNNEAMYPVRLYLNDGKSKFTNSSNILPKINVSAKAIAIADYNKDGFADIFIGGRTMPGQYGKIPQSYLLNGAKTTFTSTNNWQAGMLTDAKWVDVDGDSWLDLVVVGEWMPISIYKNNAGVIASTATLLPNTNGWWNCLQVSDVNADGKPDFFAGNLGLNSRYKGTLNEPLSMLVSDFDNNGSTDCVISCFNKGISYPLATRENLLDQMVFLRKKFIRNSQYATATVNEIFTKDQIAKAQNFEANNMQTSLFINNGNFNFSNKPLPTEAQQFPVQAIQILDVNKDNTQDLLLIGNDYSAELETGLADAGIGLCLLYKNGKLEKAQDSGFYVPGDAHTLQQIKINNKPSFLSWQMCR